jgi:hypothetical protein
VNPTRRANSDVVGENNPQTWWDEFYQKRVSGKPSEDEELHEFLNLLRAMFTMDPRSRPSALDLLLDYRWPNLRSVWGAGMPSSVLR